MNALMNLIDQLLIVLFYLIALADCGEPEIPAFGEVAITTGSSSQEARYHCRYGYELQGSEIRTCKGRTWSNEQPICKPFLAFPLALFHNFLNFNCRCGDGYLINNRVNFKCFFFRFNKLF